MDFNFLDQIMKSKVEEQNLRLKSQMFEQEKRKKEQEKDSVKKKYASYNYSSPIKHIQESIFLLYDEINKNTALAFNSFNPNIVKNPFEKYCLSGIRENEEFKKILKQIPDIFFDYDETFNEARSLFDILKIHESGIINCNTMLEADKKCEEMKDWFNAKKQAIDVMLIKIKMNLEQKLKKYNKTQNDIIQNNLLESSSNSNISNNENVVNNSSLNISSNNAVSNNLDNSSSSNKINKLNERIQELISNKEQLSKIIEELKADKNELREDKKNLQDQLKILREENLKLKNENENLKNPDSINLSFALV